VHADPRARSGDPRRAHHRRRSRLPARLLGHPRQAAGGEGRHGAGVHRLPGRGGPLPPGVPVPRGQGDGRGQPAELVATVPGTLALFRAEPQADALPRLKAAFPQTEAMGAWLRVFAEGWTPPAGRRWTRRSPASADGLVRPRAGAGRRVRGHAAPARGEAGIGLSGRQPRARRQHRPGHRGPRADPGLRRLPGRRRGQLPACPRARSSACWGPTAPARPR
jgi:hypothetical protein